MVSKNEHAQRTRCPLACALDIIGDHWTLLIIRDMLFLGKHEYREILESKEGISSNILSDRLSKLQDNGLVASIPHPESAKRKLYYLTNKGKDLIHVLAPLGKWSEKHLPGQVEIYPEIIELQKKSPADLITNVFLTLEEWEQRYDIKT
ncbi:winged helix-turn-helix transcriptional regulator [Aurantivibrio infirmus]